MTGKPKPDAQGDIIAPGAFDENLAAKIGRALERQELEFDSAWHKKADGSWELIEVSIVPKRK